MRDYWLHRIAALAWQKAYHLKIRYGISQALYNEILGNQLGLCAICCGTNPSGRNLSVDHDHKTGDIRGLLCQKCNQAVMVVENRLEEIKTYLEIV